MPRPERLDFKGAIHQVRIRGREGSSLFYDPAILKDLSGNPRSHAPNVRRFELLIGATCEGCGAVLHAYSIEPNSGALVVQTLGSPLGAFMRRLCGRYSRQVHAEQRLPKHQRVFETRYDAKIIAPEYLIYAVRRTHCSPIAAGLCQQRIDHPFSSEHAYVGDRATLHLTTANVRRALEQRGYFGMRGYRTFMDQGETRYVSELFENGAALDSRIVGGKAFVVHARQMASQPSLPVTPEQLIAGVARLMNAAPAEIFSPTRIGVLGRALVGWYGLRTGSATLSEIGRWFSVTGAAVGQAIRHYRVITPGLFDAPLIAGQDGISDQAGELCRKFGLQAPRPDRRAGAEPNVRRSTPRGAAG